MLQSLHFHHNIIVIRDSTTEQGILWVTDIGTLDDHGTLSDYNQFFTPFYTSTEHVGGTYDFSTITHRTRAAFNSLFGWEGSSTWNATGHDYQDVTGITRDQFTWVFYSDTINHTFDLAGATFENTSGADVTTSLTLDAGEYRVLFYKSGSLTGVDNPVYVNYTIGTTGGGGGTGGTGGVQRIPVDNGVERTPYDQGIERVFFD